MLADVNTTDISSAVRLGCRTMCSVFNADDGDVPFFSSQVWPEAQLSFSYMHSEAHVPGRHLNALLNAEDTLGVRLNEGCIAHHERAAFLSYAGTLPLPLNRDRVGGRLTHFSPHNVREGFHALYALARFRNSEQALAVAEASIQAIQRLWDGKTGWDTAALGDEIVFHPTPYIAGLAPRHRSPGQAPPPYGLRGRAGPRAGAGGQRPRMSSFCRPAATIVTASVRTPTPPPVFSRHWPSWPT